MGKRLKIESNTKKNKWNILNLSEEKNEESINNSAHIEIFGNNRVSVDGCLGVYEYRDTYLKLRLTKGSLIIVGSEFNITYFENRLISVKGKIASVEFV